MSTLDRNTLSIVSNRIREEIQYSINGAMAEIRSHQSSDSEISETELQGMILLSAAKRIAREMKELRTLRSAERIMERYGF